MEWVLAGLFFPVALLYSSVGLGGGSSYTALMAIFGVHYEYIPTTSLFLNLVVTSIGTVNFWRGGHLRGRLILPFLVTSVPFSYLGGAVPLSREVFYPLLLATLVFVAVRIYFWRDLRLRLTLAPRHRLLLSLGLGCVLGFVAGAVGIGGGIYLIPLIILFGLGSPKEAAAAGTLFILVNSGAGLAARLQRGVYDPGLILPLVLAVVAGGFLGSRLGSLKWQPATVQKTLGVVVLIAMAFLIRKIV
jgi:hypothetical protein